MKNETQKTVTAIAVALIITIAVVGIVWMMTNDEQGKIVSATGTSEITVEPDKAELGFRIVTRHNTSSKIASDENTNISDEVIFELMQSGLLFGDMETVSYYVSEIYEWNEGKRELKHYEAIHVIKATVKDLDDVGDIVDIAVENGALVDYCNYDLSTDELNKIKAEALEKASADAKNKAESMLKGIDKELGELVSISTDYGYYPRIAYDYDDVYAEGTVVNIKEYQAPLLLPENLDVTATVYVTFEIK